MKTTKGVMAWMLFGTALGVFGVLTDDHELVTIGAMNIVLAAIKDVKNCIVKS